MIKPRVETIEYPQISALWHRRQKGDFLDGYRVKSSVRLSDAQNVGFQFPIWVKMLLSVRNQFMAIFGLKSGSGDSFVELLRSFELGNEAERVIGMNDKHLDFRISLLRDGGYIYMATWVRPHNMFGRAYLAMVLPFHIVICRNICARIARAYP